MNCLNCDHDVQCHIKVPIHPDKIELHCKRVIHGEYGLICPCRNLIITADKEEK